MMILMDTLTDEPDWHKKVFDETIVQNWRDEARQQSEDGLYAMIMQDKLEKGPRKPRDRIITDAAFDYVLREVDLPPLAPNIDDETMAEVKWLKYRDAILPDPKHFEDVDYAPKHGLREKFKKDGLQISVKMASIELTPEKSEFSAGSRHLEGEMNAKITAAALYCFDSENVTPSRLSFRLQTSSYLNDEIKTGQDSYNYLDRVFGTDLGIQGGLARSCVQAYGDVDTPEGRLLAFPNVFQHRVSSFKLQDPTKPGHRRFIALWLVDPHRRILSTANLPPQQRDWWTGSGEVPSGLMDVEEARAHRLKLMDERTAEKARIHWDSIDYNFYAALMVLFTDEL
ncbi:hypothetical protein FDENT_12561 [Fusarium denticulatum]|uniref:Uncharacterized protein n=1 Tax=Fusarium denticulatum TaxID=48507 RepID=A0A8H5TBE3_9HYPO|nr:hypothetical protein FDENT_12561 [Fusarium denticulatum]